MNLKNITNDQIDTLLKICKENSNRQKRWNALENHPISKELDLTDIKDFTKMSCHAWYRYGEREADYLYSVEQIFTGYNKDGDDPSVVIEEDQDGKYIGYDYIRHELSGNPKTEWDFKRGKPVRLKRQAGDAIGFGKFVRVVGKFLGWGLVGITGLVVLFLAIAYMNPPLTEEEQAIRDAERAAEVAGREAERARRATEVAARQAEQARVVRERERAQVDSCMEGVERSCRRDPVFTYCSLTTGGDVIGSGCTSRVRRAGTAEAQWEFCIEGVRRDAERSCEIQVYGCLAITGNANCND